MPKEVRWPANAKIYVTARQIKASMPKLGKGKFCMPKPVNPNGKGRKEESYPECTSLLGQ